MKKPGWEHDAAVCWHAVVHPCNDLSSVVLLQFVHNAENACHSASCGVGV
jgi:hypothetical protein